MVLNAYIISKNLPGRQGTHTEYLAFLKSVIQELLIAHSPAVRQQHQLHQQRFRQRRRQDPARPPRPSYLVRRNQAAIQAANRPRRPAPRDRTAPRPDQPSGAANSDAANLPRRDAPRDHDADLDSDEDSHMRPDQGGERIRVASTIMLPQP